MRMRQFSHKGIGSGFRQYQESPIKDTLGKGGKGPLFSYEGFGTNFSLPMNTGLGWGEKDNFSYPEIGFGYGLIYWGGAKGTSPEKWYEVPHLSCHSLLLRTKV